VTASETTKFILLVEDNPADMELVREWIQEKNIDAQLIWVEDGLAAMNHLRQGSGSGPIPNLILLDINLPRMSGIDVLREIKADLNLRKIPVVMFTSSSQTDDVNNSYLSHANAYVQKNLDLEAFYKSLGSIYGLFLQTSIPPKF
jgi:two-component system, chemotaxis family, response regulator Rcp1